MLAMKNAHGKYLKLIFSYHYCRCKLHKSPVSWSKHNDRRCLLDDPWLEEKYKTWLKHGPITQIASCQECKKDLQLFVMVESVPSSPANVKLWQWEVTSLHVKYLLQCSERWIKLVFYVFYSTLQNKTTKYVKNTSKGSL